MKSSHGKFSIGETLLYSTLAVVCELIGLIPGLNILSTGVYWSIIFVVFHMKGIPFLKNKKMVAATGMSMLVGIIPFVSSILPESLIGLWVSIHTANTESEKKQKTEEVVQQKNRISRMREEIETPGKTSYRIEKYSAEFRNPSEKENPGRKIQFAKTYNPVIPRTPVTTERVLSASGAMLKNEERQPFVRQPKKTV